MKVVDQCKIPTVVRIDFLSYEKDDTSVDDRDDVQLVVSILTLSVAILIHSSKLEYICSGVRLVTIGPATVVSCVDRMSLLCCRDKTSLVNRSR